MSIALTTPVTFMSTSDSNLACVQANVDFASFFITAVYTFGNGDDSNFVADHTAPSQNVMYSFQTGNIFVNGIPKLDSQGNPVIIPAATLADIATAMVTAKKKSDAALVAAGVFSGTAS